MKTLTKHLWFNTANRHEFVNITDQVEEVVKESGVKEGIDFSFIIPFCILT